LAGCGRSASGGRAAATTAEPAPDLTGRFEQLERKYEARLGVYVPADRATAEIAYRADERFAFCSTFKAPLVAAVLHQNPPTHLDKVISYKRDDIRSVSPVTEKHVETGMTVRQLCDAAIRYSDGTAANLLLADIGGPAAFTAYLRSLGDTVSRLDQEEPELNRDAPDDERDTTTPRAIALVFQRLVLGDALPPDKRKMLTDWMGGTTTGAKRIRAGFPADWKVVDKTGTGDYGRANDVAVVWSPTGMSHVLAIMSDRADGGYNAEPREALIASAAELVATKVG
ncbi:MAG: beta-lactamase class, partial [Mycobacterium sp.]|nr:beta-lactamase class [Mycobacterium sp.]